MEWTKIKPKHFLFTDLTLSNKGCLVTLLCLTAHLERIPTDVEMFKVVRRNCFTSLVLVMQNRGTSVAGVLQKVVEDCEKIENKRAISRKTSDTYRNKKNDSDASLDATDKTREDKTREDKKIITRKTKKFDFDKVWDFYPVGGKIGKQEAMGHFYNTVKTDKDLHALCEALERFKKSKRVLGGYVMNGSRFFKEWKDWVNYEEPGEDKLRAKLAKMGITS